MLILFFVATKTNFGQIANYVSNGGFEALLSSSVTSGFDAVKYWGPIDTTQNASFLFSLSDNSSPYCSTGFQYPRSGNNFIGTQFFCNNCANTNSRFYPRNRLKQLLQAGKTYCAKYYVVNTNNNRVAIDKYGMYFGDSSIDTITKCMGQLTYLNPHVENTSGIITDTLNWTPITGTFVATGNEKYLVIGNFRSNATTNTLQLNTPLTTQSADVYIDDVSVMELNLPAYAGPDIWGIPTNTVYLGRPQDVGIDEACMWYKLPNITTAIDTAAGITVTVGITTNTYIVRQDICGNVKWDTVVVHASGVGIVSSSGVENSVVKIFPQPSDEILNIELDVYKETEFKLKIFNNLNQLVREEVLRQAQQSNGNLAFKIKTDNLPNGVYVLKLLDTASPTRSDNGVSVSKRFVINR